MTKLRCPRCYNTWNYQGKGKYVACCSKCKTTMSIDKAKKRAKGHRLTNKER